NTVDRERPWLRLLRRARSAWAAAAPALAAITLAQPLVQLSLLLRAQLCRHLLDCPQVLLLLLGAHDGHLVHERIDLGHVERGLLEFRGHRLPDLADAAPAIAPRLGILLDDRLHVLLLRL